MEHDVNFNPIKDPIQCLREKQQTNKTMQNPQTVNELHHEKTRFLQMRKQKRRSAVQLLHS